jgi:hypothetical protein
MSINNSNIENVLDPLNGARRATLSAEKRQRILKHVASIPNRIVGIRTILKVAAAVLLLIALNVGFALKTKSSAEKQEKRGFETEYFGYLNQPTLR